MQLRFKHLKAESLAKLGKYDAALALLQGDESEEGKNLALTLETHEQNWAGIVNILAPRYLLEGPAKDKKTLTDQEQGEIMRLAIAYSNLGNTDKIQELKSAYAPLFPEGKRRQSFDFLATKMTPLDYKNLEESLQLGTLENFIDDFRKPPEGTTPDAQAAPSPDAPASPPEAGTPTSSPADAAKTPPTPTASAKP